MLVLLVAVGLGLAIWSGTRKEGRGAPEDRKRVMVVMAGGEVDYFAVLERGGFEIEVDSFEDWTEAAAATLPESELEGVALLLELADERGFGHVIFEAPAELDFGELEIEPAPSSVEDFASRDYAALSVGDYAFPHRLSVDDPGEQEILRLPGYGALQALFRQPQITAREEDGRPTVEELQYEADIRVAREMIARPADFEALIEGAGEKLVAALGEEPGVTMLVEPFQTGTPIPTPDGGLLLFRHELEVYSDDAQTLELDIGPRMHFDWIGPEQLARGGGEAGYEAEACASLAEGAVEMSDLPQIEAARDGSTLALTFGDTDTQIWRKQAGPGCEWRRVAEVPPPSSARLGVGVLAPRLVGGESMLLARVEGRGGEARLRLWLDAEDPDDDDEPAGGGAVLNEVEPGGSRTVELLALEQVDLGLVRFVDGHRLAVLSSAHLDEDEQPARLVDAKRRAEHALHLVDRRRPGAHLRIPTEFFAPDRRLREFEVLDAGGPDRGPAFLISALNPDDEVELIELRVAAEAFADLDARLAAAREEDEGEGADERELLTLTPEDLEVRVLLTRSSLFELVLSPDKSRLAFGFIDGPAPSELAVVELDGGEPRVLTDNEVRDYLPRFTADGRRLAFASLTRVWISQVPFSVPRIAEIPGGAAGD